MFFNNSRIESKNGIRFYEKDILLSDNVFTGDIVIELDIDYYSPGFGILINKYDEREPNNKNNMFLFKLGFRDFTVISKLNLDQKELLRTSNIISAPRERLKLTFSKKGRNIEMKTGDINLGTYQLKDTIDKYKIGIYSNSRNCVRDISYYTGAPNNWNVNIANTNGGNISFHKDGFEIRDCIRDAEIEQSKISVKAGEYYFGYESNGDINAYVFEWNDERFDDNEKNILIDNHKVVISEDTFINVKFKGTYGSVNNICLKNSKKEKYVSTDRLPIVTSGSEMIIKLKGLKSVLWEGIISNIPEDDSIISKKKYFILSSKNTKLYIEDISVIIGEKYSYELIVADKLLIIKTMGGNEICRKNIIIEENEEIIKVFKNITATIDRIFVTKNNGEQIEVLLQKTNKAYIPFEIKGPILVLDKDYIPLNLSASYRENVNTKEYVFTNWEREIFESVKLLYFENKMIDISGNIKVYGIPHNAITNEDNIFKIDKVDSIDLYSDKYDIITESNFEIDYYNNIIKLKDGVADKYKSIIIDYLKDDSYCINYIDSLRSYEVDTSTSKEKIFVMYDFISSDQKYGNVSEYKVTDIIPDHNKYIVLRKDGY